MNDLVAGLEGFVNHVNRVRKEQGPEAADQLFREYALSFIRSGHKGRLFAQGLLQDHPKFSYADLVKEVESSSR